MNRYNAERPLVSMDSETFLFGPGNMAPKLVCVSFGWYEDGKVKTLLMNHEDGAQQVEDLLHQCVKGELTLSLHNAPYDVAVMAVERPRLLELFFDAYEVGGVHCTMAAEWLNDTAMGLLRAEWSEEKEEYIYKKQYSLENLARIHLDQLPYKDEWRMRYGELHGVPIKQWPERAREYPQQDAEFTLRVAQAQRELAERISPHNPLIANLAHVCRSYLALHLVSVWGQEVDPERVETLNECLASYVDSIVFEGEDDDQSIEQAGLIVRTKKGKNIGKLTEKKLRLQEMVAQDLLGRGIIEHVGSLKEDSSDWLPEELLTKGGKKGVRVLSTGAAVLSECVDPILQRMASYKEGKKIQSSFGNPLAKFARGPMHSRYNYAETGRTTCSGGSKRNRTGLNIQQLITGMPDKLEELMIEMIGDIIDVRSCIVPRKGYVYSSSDYSSLEMCTFAEVLMQKVGWSSLREAINADVDPHVKLAAEQWLHVPYEKALHMVEVDKDPFASAMRKLAKVPNFGLPGGMGGATLVKYAKGFYGAKFVREHFGLTQTQQVNKGYKIKDAWFETWPETPEYMNIMGEEVGDGDATIIQLVSERIHGGCTFTMACNTLFQGLAADLATDALWRIVRECYDVRLNTALYGSRVVGFVHDEYIGEHPVEAQHEAATRLAEIAVDTGQAWCPSVKFKCEPALMDRWHKKASTVRDDNGRLQVWQPKPR